jgi:hypothetical protein
MKFFKQPWQAYLLDPDGFVTTPADALDEFGPEANVAIRIQRSAIAPDSENAKLPDATDSDVVALDFDLNLVDEDGETTAVEAKLTQARAMAAGLNRADANPRSWNRGTELAATLHDLADRIAEFDGEIPSGHIMFAFYDRDEAQKKAKVDALGTALLDSPGTSGRSSSTGWEHKAEQKIGDFGVIIFAPVKPPEDEDPAALRARIAELEQQLADGGEQS